MIILFKFN